MKMKKSILTILIGFLFISPASIFAQIEATTKDGKNVILNLDGTWKYIETETNDTVAESESNDDCSNYIETWIDKVSGTSSISAKDKIFITEDGGKYGFGIYLIGARKSIIASIQAVGSGNCIDDDAKINILFRDGSRIKIINNGDFNCEAKATLYFGGVFGRKSELNDLSTKEIETMRVWTYDGYVQMDFTPKQSKELLNTLRCLSES